ncbi:hypothetical protein FLAN108750_01450 [Flavobacterium antarcticum]|uniref:hypothetical protein n=1 Tax=Flavobacterium antarcticum TaxID=271155 RepID=UPI0003B61264|nr:hypothetical protein [Flavobacterium antarcticum]
MMNIFSKIVVLFIVFSSVQSYAQYYNPNSRGGLDRSIGAENRYSKEPKKEPVDYVKVMADNLTDKLKLDGFQSAIVKNLIEEYVKNVNEIGLENIPNDAKVEKSQIARTTMEEKFTAIFSEKQKVLFEELKDKNTSKKNDKKNKKSKKKSEESE